MGGRGSELQGGKSKPVQSILLKVLHFSSFSYFLSFEGANLKNFPQGGVMATVGK